MLNELIEKLRAAGVEVDDALKFGAQTGAWYYRDRATSDVMAGAICLMHLKAWLRGRENVVSWSIYYEDTDDGLEFSCLFEHTPEGATHSATIDGPDAATELEALSVCVLEYLGGKQ